MTPSLVRTVTTGANGTRIYQIGNKYYAVDGEIDCRLPDATAEIKSRAWKNGNDLNNLVDKVHKDLGL